MITVNKDWVIDVDDRNYKVCRNKPHYDKNKKKMLYPVEAYYGTLVGAIEYIVKQSGTNALIDKETDLEGAIKTIQTAQEEIAEIVKRAIPDAKIYFT